MALIETARNEEIITIRGTSKLLTAIMQFGGLTCAIIIQNKPTVFRKSK